MIAQKITANLAGVEEWLNWSSRNDRLGFLAKFDDGTLRIEREGKAVWIAHTTEKMLFIADNRGRVMIAAAAPKLDVCEGCRFCHGWRVKDLSGIDFDLGLGLITAAEESFDKVFGKPSIARDMRVMTSHVLLSLMKFDAETRAAEHQIN